MNFSKLLFFNFFFLFSINLTFGCQKVDTVENFNLTEYIKDRWFIQKQQETFYLPKEYNYCVSAYYRPSHKKILFYDGEVIDVFNYAEKNKVNGEKVNKNNFTLCARIPNHDITSKLLVAPCFLPNFFGGDYWVIAAGPKSDNYEWAIISGGQPDVQLKDGCTTKTKGVNSAGFWYFTRNQYVSEKLLNFMDKKAKEKGFSTSLLNKVEQKGCLY